ncbi:Rhomboid family protein [Chroococcus sp. FPU101]|nr:Rhomboid family protein [Chroococcus sp. FPU101]
MKLSDFLFLTVCFFCLLYFLEFIRFLPKNKGWLLVSGFILLLTLGLRLVNTLAAGVIGLVLVIFFLIIPKIGFSVYQKLMVQQQYRTAKILMTGLSLLHPFDSWLQQPKLIYSLALAKEGKLEKSLNLLKSFPDDNHHSQILSFYIQGDWENGLNWIERYLPYNILFSEPDLLLYYLRALGETGKLNKLLKIYQKTEGFLKRNGSPLQVYQARMYALAFCGQVLQVRQLLQVPLRKLPLSVQQFWLGTAQMIAGKKAYSYSNLAELLTQKDFILKKAIDWRLDHPYIESEKILNKESYQIINQIKLEVDQEFYPRIFNFSKTRKAYATYLLIGVNLAFFGMQIKTGGSENLERLYQLGALVPEAVLAGQWWRVITANFLHFGLLHLLTNMSGLYILGRLVESALGFYRFLLIYLFSGIGSMILYTILSLKTQQNGYILMGASAAIMGLLGALFIIFIKEWFYTKSKFTAKRIQLIIVTIGLQFTFDYFVPHISMLSHATGLLLGLVISLFLVGKVVK